MKIISHQLPTNNKEGFTLIELLIALTVTGIIFALGFANFRDYSRRQALFSAKRELLGELRNAQELAVSGQKPGGLCITNPLEGYRFEWRSDLQLFRVIADCTAGLFLVKTISVPDGMEISTPFSNFVDFYSLGNGTNVASGDLFVIKITQTDTGYIQDISVNTTGQIQ